MRIISKYHDYYDVVAGQGVDLTRIFTRNTTEFKGNFPLDGWDVKHYWRSQEDNNYPRADAHVYTANKRHSGPELYHAEYVYVLFAGKVYGGIALKNTKVGDPEFGNISYFWDVDAWTDKTEEIGLAERKSFSDKPYGKGAKSDKERFEKVLSIKGDEYLRDWAIENKLSIAIACGFFNTRERGDWFVVDPNLKELNFQRVLDPFTAYQELDQWIGGVLGNNEIIPEMADKDKIAAHGFNSWSFRKHKLDNK